MGSGIGRFLCRDIVEFNLFARLHPQLQRFARSALRLALRGVRKPTTGDQAEKVGNRAMNDRPYHYVSLLPLRTCRLVALPGSIWYCDV